jgi:hypothetical protein
MKRFSCLLTALGLAMLTANFGSAAPVTLRFTTTMDATIYGRDAAEPFAATFTYDTSPVNGTGPFALTPDTASYGPLTMLLQVGADSATSTGGGVTLQDLPPGGGVDAFHILADNNGFSSSQEDWSGEILGFDVSGFVLQVFDNQAVMLDDLELPTTSSFAADADYASIGLALHNGGTINFDVTSFSLTSVPEPSTMILVVAALGVCLARRRRRIILGVLVGTVVVGAPAQPALADSAVSWGQLPLGNGTTRDSNTPVTLRAVPEPATAVLAAASLGF